MTNPKPRRIPEWEAEALFDRFIRSTRLLWIHGLLSDGEMLKVMQKIKAKQEKEAEATR